ncbi:homing endonuclease associated repeat-containing protein [Natrinema caseinilyticum]|uniref:homing endonuclease associated repeat-containing protein n=1 Tax=Natrinema caseinilyticum TaxID=2961570 RepID=UPI0020C4ACB5|nr:hypothetical protein [Natrinema caseinilyticum]
MDEVISEGDRMTDLVSCPADTCSFEGSISEIADHVTESDDKDHAWEVFGHENADEFCYDAHLEEGRRLQDAAQEAKDLGEFDEAIEGLEAALYHLQRATLFADAPSPIENRCREALETIDEIETAEQIQELDDLIDQAENAIDAGDEAHFEGNTDAARQKYEAAVDALEEAVTRAEVLVPDRTQEIDHQLRSVRVRLQSLELSESHRRIRNMVADAREHAAAGDLAFQKSEYDVALDEYEKAKDQYESLADSLEAFSFDEPTTNPEVCDVCRQRFDDELDSWQINLSISLQVCPACARFGSDGNLPSPRDVATEHRAIVENIESIQDGDIGLDWTSDEAIQSDESEDVNFGSAERDTQQMLIQLVGLCQQLGEAPTAEDLDEYTDFSYLDYRDEFGSLSEALQAAGLGG